jgi:hypothetical protein
MQWYWYVPPAVAVLALCVWLFRRRQSVHAWGREFQVARARELFALQRERLEGLFLKAAAATGKPRGLRWVRCDFDSALVFAREKLTRQLVGLVSVTIQFEAIEGSDMEGLAAVGNLRNATAVFSFTSGHWQTSGKAVFNLNPPEVLNHFQKDYEPVQEPQHEPALPSPNGDMSAPGGTQQ